MAIPSVSNRWSVLALMFLVRFCIPIQYQSVIALSPFLRSDLGFTHTQIGMLFGLYFLPGAVVALPGGVLGSRYGGRSLMLFSLGLMMAGGTLFMLGQGIQMMIIGRLISGVGAVVLTVQIVRIVTDWFAGKELATAQSVSVASFGLGIGVAVSGLSSMAYFTSWRTANWSVIGLVALLLIFVALFYRDPPGIPQEQSQRPTWWNLSIREGLLTAIAGLAWAFWAVTYLVYMGYAPRLLTEQGYGIIEAGGIIGATALIGLFAGPMGGYLVDRTKKPAFFVALGAFGTILIGLGMPLGGIPLVWVLLYALTRSGCTGALAAMPGELLRPKARSTGFGVYFTCNFLGQGLLIPIAGYLSDTTEGATAALWFTSVAGLSFLLAYVAFRTLVAIWPSPMKSN